MHEHVFTRLHVRTSHEHVPRGDSHEWQRRRLGPAQLRRLGNDVHAWNRHQFRITTVTSIADHVVLTTQIVLPAETRLAMPARNAGLDHHFVARFDPRHELANFPHDASYIATENVRERNLDPRQTVANKNVEMIQRARL